MASFYRFHVPEKQKLIKTNSQSHVGWPVPRKDKVLWKTTTKIKVSFTEKKVLYFKDSFTFQSKSCILKKLLYQTESFIYLKESIIAKQKVLLKYYDIKWKYYDTKQVSLIFSKESNKVPNCVPYVSLLALINFCISSMWNL